MILDAREGIVANSTLRVLQQFTGAENSSEKPMSIACICHKRNSELFSIVRGSLKGEVLDIHFGGSSPVQSFLKNLLDLTSAGQGTNAKLSSARQLCG